MKRSAYRDRDYTFGQTMLTLRAAIGLTQIGLAEFLGVSRRAVGAWESGSKYPKTEHLKRFIALAVQRHAFPVGREAEEIRALWKAAHQKVLLDERWIAALLAQPGGAESPIIHSVAAPLTEGAAQTTRRKATINLPFQPTPFIGRVAELSEIARILADPACRLLTLLGPGGVGKTRLALEVAAQQADRFADGFAFVPLASVGTPNQIASAIGDALHLSFTGQRDITHYLLEYLHDRHLLLILDNFEHLLEGVDLVYDIIEHAPQVTMLITSRERLNLQSEWLFDVEGLTYPPETVTVQNLSDLADYNAVQLFTQRVKQIQPGFPLLKSNLTTIARICQYVAGMPLAIELAGANIRTHSIEEIEQQIRLNLDALSTALRDVPARHRSMRAVIDHSWNLMSEPERVLFSRLAVFRGGCTVEAAEQVTGATLPALLTLMDKSLLRQINNRAASKETVEPRFLLLEPIREYALEKLIVRGEAEALQNAHAVYYLAMAEEAMANWDIATAAPAIEQINHDLNNIRAALRWASDGRYSTIGLQLAGVLWRFWRSSGYTSEGRGWLDKLLALTEPDDDKPAMRARLLGMHAAAWLASDQHDYVRATQLFEQSVPLRRALGETEADTHMLHNAALQARAVGQYQQATALLEEALARNRVLSTGGLGHSLYEMGFSLYGLGLLLREQGEFVQAAALFKESLQFHQEIGDRESMAQALLGLGDIARDQGDVAQTRAYTDQSLTIYQEFGTQWAIGFALNNLALAAYLDDDLAGALALASESVSLFRTIQNDGGIAEALVTLGYILAAQGDVNDAQDALTEALRLAWVIGPRLLVIAALEGVAVLMAQARQTAPAVRLLSTAAAAREQMGTPLRPIDRPAVEDILETARLSLGDTFTTVWEEARTLSLEQILSAIPGVSSDDAPPLSQVSSTAALIEETSGTIHMPDPPGTARRTDWDDALFVPIFYGREWELNLLAGWVIEERCRVVSVLGLGGVGKSAVAVSLMHRLEEHFDLIIWRSLRDLPNCDVLLDDLLQVVAPQALGDLHASLERRQARLLDYMRSARVLLVLDNLESVLEGGQGAGQLQTGYEGIGRFLRLCAETEHRSCVLLTSREKLADLVPHEGSHAPVRALRLGRLNAEACEQLLVEKGVKGSAAERARLSEAYGGNPLALKMVAQTVVDLFDGELAPFLEQGELIFGGIRELLTVQFNRLSVIEQSVVFWFAILREPSTLDELVAVLVTPVPRAQLLEVIDSLRRRSLIEPGQMQGSFTLQSVVLEYVTVRLIAEASDEIIRGQLTLVTEHGLALAQSREYVRQNQERLITAPILANLRSNHPHQAATEDALLALLVQLRMQHPAEQGYAPSNLIALLRLHRGHLRGLDLSRLALRGAYLQGVEMLDTRLVDATIQDSVFSETFDALTAVAVSGSGQFWAASSTRGEVLVWEAGGLTLYRVWQAHADMVWALAFSPDGHTLATGSWDGMVKLWDVASGALLWSARHSSHVNGVTFAPDGYLLASSGNDSTVRLWDRQSGAQLQTLPHPSPVIAVAWSSDEGLIATGDAEGCIRLWMVSRTEPAICMQTLTGHNNWVDGLAFSPDARTLASASWDGTVKLWDVSTGLLRQTLSGHTDQVSRVVWSPDGRALASSSRDQTIWLWDVEQASYRVLLRGHTLGAKGLAFMPDSRSLLSGGGDGTLRVWDAASGQCVRVIHGYASSLSDIDWSPDGTQLVSGGTDTMVTVYNVTGETLHVLPGHSGVVIGVGWSSDGQRIATSEWDNIIRLWDPPSGTCLQVLNHPDDPGNYFAGLVWSPDGYRLAAGTYRRSVFVWDVVANRQPWTGHQLSTWIRPVDWSPDGRLLAGGGDDGMVYVWDAAEGSLLQRLMGHHSMITNIAWSPDGTRLASSCRGIEGGELFVWDIQRGERLRIFEGHPGIVYAAAWGLNDEEVVSGDGDGILRWWDVQSGECILTQPAHQGAIQSLRRSPDGMKLASCGDDGAIMIWDMHTGDYLQTLRRDRPYERLNIRGIKGLTEAQKATLRALGAIEDSLTF